MICLQNSQVANYCKFKILARILFLRNGIGFTGKKYYHFASVIAKYRENKTLAKISEFTACDPSFSELSGRGYA